MINPILASSARRRMRTINTPIMVTLYGALLVAFSLLTLSPLFSDTISIGVMRQGVEGYIELLALQFFMIVLVTPAMTAGAISGERERQTLDLLLVTNTGAFRLVMGRLLESFFFLALLILCSFPAMSLILIMGGITLPQMLTGLAFLMVSAYAALCVGLFCSCLFRRTVTATVVAYLAVFGIGFVTLLPIFSDVRRIGAVIDQANAIGAAVTSIDVLPLSFVLNPALALLSLIVDQTGLLQTTLTRFSYTLYTAFDAMHFGQYALYGMVFMAVAGTILLLLGALFVRPSKRAKGRRGA